LSLNIGRLPSWQMEDNKTLDARDAQERTTASALWKTPVFLALMILSNLCGDVCLRLGLRDAGNLLTKSLRGYFHAAFNPWVGVGMAFYLIWMLTQMALFSWADLSYVVPITSVGYALAAIAGWLFLGEIISNVRWFGITIIVFGVVLVSRTPARTTERQRWKNDS